MKRICMLVVLAVAMSLQSLAATRADSIRARLLEPNTEDILVAVHRGDWRGYAENSIEGINSAIRMGADIVEIDLQLTADSVLILMHDRTIDRSTTGRGTIAEMTYDEISKCRLRNGVRAHTPYRIPTLEEVLVETKGRVLLNLDKAFDYFDLVMQLLEKTGTTSQIIMKGSNPADEVLEKYGAYLDKVIYMPIINVDKPDAKERVQDCLDKLHPVAIEFTTNDHSNLVGEEIREMMQGRSRVWYNTLWASLCGGRDDFLALDDPEAAYGFLIDRFGTSIFQTDQPAYIIEYIKNRK